MVSTWVTIAAQSITMLAHMTIRGLDIVTASVDARAW